jgi:hypothetical protein
MENVHDLKDGGDLVVNKADKLGFLYNSHADIPRHIGHTVEAG